MSVQRSTVGSLLRSTQAYCAQLSAKETLDEGIAYYCEAFRDLPEANQFREVMMGDAQLIPAVFASVERWVSMRGLTCHRWAPAGGQCESSLSDHLFDHGFRALHYVALALARWVDLQPDPSIRVLPARAMRAAHRATFMADESSNPLTAKLLADSAERRLDDPQYDTFVALIDNVPAGRCALYQVGDFARVMDLAVLPAFAQRGVDHAFLAHVLALARRLEMRTVCVQIDADAEDDLALFESAGFVADGEIVEFERNAATAPDAAP